ncbi:MAG TPA: hypothetical protein VFK02_05970 [Kofleriaceae bacterium]|nr:hypothetical protein [Kofleriaceae bacterium]
MTAFEAVLEQDSRAPARNEAGGPAGSPQPEDRELDERLRELREYGCSP